MHFLLRGKRVGGLAAALAAVVASPGWSQSLPPYAIVEIPSLGGTFTAARAINGLGQVTGSSFLGGNGFYRPFVFEPEVWPPTTNELPLPPDDEEGPWTDGQGEDLNDGGQVTMYAVGRPGYTAALHDPITGETTDISLSVGTDYCFPHGIGEERHIAGTFDDPSDNTDRHQGFLWTPVRGFIDLGTLGGPGEEDYWESGAYGINTAAGLIVGTVGGPYDEPDPEHWPVYWDIYDLEIHILNDGGATYSVTPYAANDSGQIVGHTAAYWSSVDAEPIFLPLRPRDDDRPYAIADDINNRGVILGSVFDREGRLHEVVWPSPSARDYVEPVRLLPPKHRWQHLDSVEDLNDANQLVGFGRRIGDTLLEQRGFILSPVYPTFDLSTPSPGNAGTGNTFTITGLQPGEEVALVYGLNGGGALIPGCNLQTNALQIDNPITAGSAVANSSGIATIQGFVPNAARNRTILFQALVQGRCAISGLVVHRFQ